jgi:hypothetical protein
MYLGDFTNKTVFQTKLKRINQNKELISQLFLSQKNLIQVNSKLSLILLSIFEGNLFY